MTWHRVLLLTLAIAGLLTACGGPRPTVAPVESTPMGPTAQPTPDLAVLPPDGWFSIQAIGKVSPSTSDIVIAYQDGHAVYFNQNTGQQFRNQLDDKTKANWERMFIAQAQFMTLNDDYVATTPEPDDSVHYVLRYRQGGTVKIVKAQLSGSPPELQTIIQQFWYLIDQIQATS